MIDIDNEIGGLPAGGNEMYIPKSEDNEVTYK